MSGPIGSQVSSAPEPAADPNFDGKEGIKGTGGPPKDPPPSNSQPWQRVESGTLTMRFLSHQHRTKEAGYWDYLDPETKVTVRRYLLPLDKEGEEAEKEAFSRAVEHLTGISSSTEVFEKQVLPPRKIDQSSMVLIDKLTKKRDDTHTYCLWKKSDTVWMIFDPSNHTFSNKIADFQKGYPFSIEVRTFTFLKFYESPTEPPTKNDNRNESSDRTDRDCIDIAFKISRLLIFYQQYYFRLDEVEKGILTLSNQQKVNSELFISGKSAQIGVLQSSTHEQREKTVSLLKINIKFTEHIKVGDFKELKELDKIRVQIFETLDKEEIARENLFTLMKKIASKGFTLQEFKDNSSLLIDILIQNRDLEQKEQKIRVKYGEQAENQPKPKPGKR